MSWKSLLFEEAEEKKPAPKSTPGLSASMAMSIATAASASAPGSPFTAAPVVVLDESVYQRVFAKTDFDQTDVAKSIHHYFDTLPDTLDINAKFKIAMGQASKLDGITADKVLAAFDGLKTKLQAEQDGFANAVGDQNQKEVAGRQQKLQSINEQIAKLQQSITDLQTQSNQVSAELVDAQNKIANAQQQFGLATQRRSSEIDQQKAQFAALLK